MHEDAHRHLSATDKRLAELIRRSARYALAPGKTLRPFDALAESIVYQQLSGKAAATIWRRVREVFGSPKFLDPKKVLATADEALRAAGLSRNKTAALKDLAQKTIDRIVPTARALAKMSDEEIIERLTQVRGIGRWTVEMMLIFRLARPDVLPATDYGVRKGFALVHKRDELPSPAELLDYGERWRPYRSIASWYLWRVLDL
jgi:DNA-3-methyladenine glycosylase II